jgi:hypothetical protein
VPLLRADVTRYQRVLKNYTLDFKTTLVVFARNTQFYNRISIGKVNETNGVVQVLATEIGPISA